MFILEGTKCNPAGLQKESAQYGVYFLHSSPDEALALSVNKYHKECLANAQMISLTNLLQCIYQDGLPIENRKYIKETQKILDEYLNEITVIYTLCKPYEYFR